MCRRVDQFFACGCQFQLKKKTQKWILRRCQDNCGTVTGKSFVFGPNTCDAHGGIPVSNHSPRNETITSTHPDKLTVGIEFEFFVAQEGSMLLQDDVSPDRWMLSTANAGLSPSDAVKRHIVALLEDTVPIYSAAAMGRSIEWLKKKMAKFQITSLTEFPEYSMWQITTDSSLRALRDEDPAGYIFSYTNMEIISCVLSEDGLAEIDRVYRKMRSSMRMHVNRTCGLHVHVGVGHLDLLQIKKLVTVLIAFEPFLFHLVAPGRKENQFCVPLTTKSIAFTNDNQEYDNQGNEAIVNLGRNDENDEMNVWIPTNGLSSAMRTTLRHIWNATTLAHIRNELKPLFAAQKSCAMLRGEQSGVDMDGNFRPGDPTIEFRHREASGDPVVDIRWVEMCVALVRCAQLSQGEFVDLISLAVNANVQLSSPPPAGAFAVLLGALGLDASVDFWQGVYQRYQDRLADPPAPAILSPLPIDSEEA